MSEFSADGKNQPDTVVFAVRSPQETLEQIGQMVRRDARAFFPNHRALRARNDGHESAVRRVLDGVFAEVLVQDEERAAICLQWFLIGRAAKAEVDDASVGNLARVTQGYPSTRKCRMTW